MGYTLTITPSAHRALRKLPISVQKRLRQALLRLAEDPFAMGADIKKLKGMSYYRIRVGDYRVIYDLRTHELQIIVLEAGHRQSMYH